MTHLPPYAILPGERLSAIRDPDYLAWIRQRPCLLCGYPTTTEAHHEPPKGMGGGRSNDYDAVPLCGAHHRKRHGEGFLDADDMREVLNSRRVLLQLYVSRRKR